MWILPVSLMILFIHTLKVHSQSPQIKFEGQLEVKKENIEAQIKNVELKSDEIRIEVEVKNPTETPLFITADPVGYNGSILSVLEASKDRKSITILSYLEGSERVCTKPFNSNGIYLEKILPKSSITLYYKLPNSRIRIRPFCGLSYEVDMSRIEQISVILGYFADDIGIESMFNMRKRLDENESINIGEKASKRLSTFQSIIHLSSSLQGKMLN